MRPERFQDIRFDGSNARVSVLASGVLVAVSIFADGTRGTEIFEGNKLLRLLDFVSGLLFEKECLKHFSEVVTDDTQKSIKFNLKNSLC